MVLLLGQLRRLIQVAELAIGHPQPQPGGPGPGQGDIAGISRTSLASPSRSAAMATARPCRGTWATRILPPMTLPGRPADRPQPLVHTLDLLTVEVDDLESVQRRGQGLEPETAAGGWRGAARRLRRGRPHSVRVGCGAVWRSRPPGRWASRPAHRRGRWPPRRLPLCRIRASRVRAMMVGKVRRSS